jgi:hypothetical protein
MHGAVGISAVHGGEDVNILAPSLMARPFDINNSIPIVARDSESVVTRAMPIAWHTDLARLRASQDPP